MLFPCVSDRIPFFKKADREVFSIAFIFTIKPTGLRTINNGKDCVAFSAINKMHYIQLLNFAFLLSFKPEPSPSSTPSTF